MVKVVTPQLVPAITHYASRPIDTAACGLVLTDDTRLCVEAEPTCEGCRKALKLDPPPADDPVITHLLEDCDDPYATVCGKPRDGAVFASSRRPPTCPECLAVFDHRKGIAQGEDLHVLVDAAPWDKTACGASVGEGARIAKTDAELTCAECRRALAHA